MNNDYYDSAFSDVEKSLIVGSEGVFLLSTNQAKAYFSSDDARKAMYDGSYCNWWLITPGHDSQYAAYVDDGGYVNGFGYGVYGTCGVRPALWINLES